MTIRIAVTGVGNPLGQNIFKALEMSSLPLRLYSLDANPFSAGFFRGEAVLCTRADSPDYIDEFITFLKQQMISAVFFGTEAEPAVLRPHRERIQTETGTVLMLNDAAVLSVADDKYLTALALAEAGLDHPASAPADDAEAVAALMSTRDFPFIAKPRKGSASRGLARIRNSAELDAHRRKGFVIQECLLPDDAEYTVGVYRCRNGAIAATTVIRRDLDFGLTYRGIIDHEPVIATYAESVVAALDAVGSCNVQLRLTARGPVCFEVNPRFSSTTPVRAHFGVNEPELALREYVLGERLPRLTARPGAVLREWKEVYLEADEMKEMLARDLSFWKGTA